MNGVETLTAALAHFEAGRFAEHGRVANDALPLQVVFRLFRNTRLKHFI